MGLRSFCVFATLFLFIHLVRVQPKRERRVPIGYTKTSKSSSSPSTPILKNVTVGETEVLTSIDSIDNISAKEHSTTVSQRRPARNQNRSQKSSSATPWTAVDEQRNSTITAKSDNTEDDDINISNDMDGSEDSWNNDTSSSVTRTMQTTTDTPPTVDKVAVSATPIRNASTNSATEVSKKDLGGSSSSAGIILTVLIIILVLIIAGIIIFLVLRRRKQKKAVEQAKTKETLSPKSAGSPSVSDAERTAVQKQTPSTILSFGLSFKGAIISVQKQTPSETIQFLPESLHLHSAKEPSVIAPKSTPLPLPPPAPTKPRPEPKAVSVPRSKAVPIPPPKNGPTSLPKAVPLTQPKSTPPPPPSVPKVSIGPSPPKHPVREAKERSNRGGTSLSVAGKSISAQETSDRGKSISAKLSKRADKSEKSSGRDKPRKK